MVHTKWNAIVWAPAAALLHCVEPDVWIVVRIRAFNGSIERHWHCKVHAAIVGYHAEGLLVAVFMSVFRTKKKKSLTMLADDVLALARAHENVTKENLLKDDLEPTVLCGCNVE